MKRVLKGILIIAAIMTAIFLLGFNGDLDFDEYIEVNSTPKSRYINF